MRLLHLQSAVTTATSAKFGGAYLYLFILGLLLIIIFGNRISLTLKMALLKIYVCYLYARIVFLGYASQFYSPGKFYGITDNNSPVVHRYRSGMKLPREREDGVESIYFPPFLLNKAINRRIFLCSKIY